MPPFRRITVVPGQGYEPGTVERGLSGTIAAEPPGHGELDITYPAR